MSNYNSLKTTIDANIKQNGRQEITGQILNSVLNQMVTTLGAEYQFAGVATKDTNPGTPDAKVFYIANGKGTYEKFGGINVTEDEVVVLYWDSSWHKEATGITSNEKLTELEGKVDKSRISIDYVQASLPKNSLYIGVERGNISSSGVDVDSETRIRTIGYIPVSESINGRVGCYVDGVLKESNPGVRYYDESKNFIASTYSSQCKFARIMFECATIVNVTFKLPNNTTYYGNPYLDSASKDEVALCATKSDLNEFKSLVQNTYETKMNGVVYSNSKITIKSMKISADITNEQISSIDNIVIYIGTIISGKYVGGLLFRQSTTNIIDLRQYFDSVEEAVSFTNNGIIDTPKVKLLFSHSYVRTEISDTITGVSIDYNKVRDEKIGLVAESLGYADFNVKCDNKVEVEEISGAFITAAGALQPTSNPYAYTKPIFVHKGDVLKFNAQVPNTVSAVSKTDVFGSSYTPLVVGKTNANCYYEYEITEDCFVAFSYNTSSDRAFYISGYKIVSEVIGLEFISPFYISPTGERLRTSSNCGYSKPIKVYKGDVVHLRCAGTKDLFTTLSYCDKFGIYKRPIFIADEPNNGVKDYQYTIDEDGYIYVCCYLFDEHSLVITRQLNKEIIMSSSSEYVNGFEYDELKRGYVEQSKFIPDLSESQHGILCYEAEKSITSGHIVNAVSYEDGTIIAARDNGNIVKILPNGNESTLLTINNASEWRCLYMDSKGNVYASPHSSLDYSAMNVADRGLYRLPYGGNTFTKVISLYNPSSLVQTETQDNDDTIWTMCEDGKGYLYAGVYAHSKRKNPAFYRSTDGGVTWEYLVNLINDGTLASDGVMGRAVHIHCVIYNPYNEALYCIVGEVNTILKSTDNGLHWKDLKIAQELYKGTTLIAVPDGLLIGSDGIYEGVISKLYSDDKTIKPVGKMWMAEFFGMRRSDVSGWIYAFSKIEPTVKSVYPPVEAITDESALENWKSTASGSNVRNWTTYNEFVSAHYKHDAIRPRNAAIVVSRDNGESWEIVYKKDAGDAGGGGFYCIGHFRNGECLCGFASGDTSLKFSNPIVVSEGKHKYGANGVDLSEEIFGKIVE